MTNSTPIDVLDKPQREEENWDDENEEIAKQDKVSEVEPKCQKGKHKATTKGVFKAPKSRKTTSSKPSSPIASEYAPKKLKKRKTKINSFIMFSTS